MNETLVKGYHQGIVDEVEARVQQYPNPVHTGEAFCAWCLEQIFDQSEDEALDAQDASGGFDHSIDALFCPTERKLVVVQTKYESSHSWEAITKFLYDMSRIKDRRVRDGDASEDAMRAIARIYDAYDDDYKVEYYYITSDSFSALEKAKIETTEGVDDYYFFYDLEEIVNHLENKQSDIPDTVKGKWFKILLSKNSEVLTFQDSTAVIAVSLAEIHNLIDQTSTAIFASNVRQYLGNTNINKAIRHTIENNPSNFWIYNNGITIVCDDFESGRKYINVLAPQIVNGCQTAQSIYEILSKKTKTERETFRGDVLVRVIKGANEEKDDIIRFTNTQNAVRGKDFFSLEDFQRKLRRKFRRLGYYYEIQRGSYTGEKKSEKAKYKGDEAFKYLVGERFSNRITAMESVQSYTAGFKMFPAVAYGSSQQLTPGGTYYDQIFDEELQPIPALFLYPFLVREWAKNNGYSRGGQDWRAYSLFLFVSGYFALVLTSLKEIKLIDALEKNPLSVPLPIWEQIFRDENLNKSLLRSTDDALERYFTDSKVIEVVGQDVRAHLRNQEQLEKFKPILEGKIQLVASRDKERNDYLRNLVADLL